LLLKPILLGAALGGVVAAFMVTPPSRPSPQPEAAAPVVAPSGDALPTAVGRRAPSDRAAVPVAATALPSLSPSPPHASGAPEESLADERVILDDARRALAEGRTATALDALGRHARDFPRGRLSEEREGLWILVLARAGNAGEACARAARFRDNYPRSILLPAIESAAGQIP
jgi:hypothetical protein